MPRYVLCRPQGGLNDTLCQIERCCVYAEQFDRRVIVDTNYLHARTFWAPFSNYFTSKTSNLFLDYAPFENALDALTVYPTQLSSQINSYHVRKHLEILVKDDDPHHQILSFDFEQDYDEDVLVHHQWGGGRFSNMWVNV